jgi:hypothetical protein
MFLKKLLYISMPVILLLSGCTNKTPSPNGAINYEDNSGKKWAEQTNVTSINESNISSEDLMTQDKQVRIPFPIQEYSQLSKKGRATVKGKIYLDNNYGDKIYGKNTRLYLNPVTSYSKQWYEQSYLGGYKLTKADKRLYNYLKFTTSDANGNFSFYGIASGSYYLIGSVNYNNRKLRITSEIEVTRGKVVNINLTRETN